MFMYRNQKAYLARNFNCYIETESLLKVTVCHNENIDLRNGARYTSLLQTTNRWPIESRHFWWP